MTKIYSIPKNATLFVSPAGQEFYAPENTDFKAIHDVAKSKSPPAEAAAIAQFGLFDFQRNMGHGKQKDNFFYSAYTDASNYAVGVYMHGLGYSRNDLLRHGRGYALIKSSNAGDPRQESMWLKGWDDAEAESFAKAKVPTK